MAGGSVGTGKRNRESARWSLEWWPVGESTAAGEQQIDLGDHDV
jgi:hypothetical protein